MYSVQGETRGNNKLSRPAIWLISGMTEILVAPQKMMFLKRWHFTRTQGHKYRQEHRL